MKTTILIDWDDTIWDFQANSHLALQILYDQQSLGNYFSSFGQFYKLYTDKNHQLWESYSKGEVSKEFLSTERFHYPLRTVDCNDVELAKKLGPLYLQLTTEQNILIEGAADAVRELAEKYKLVIISNGFTEVQFTKINNSGLAACFSDIILSEQVGVQKPDSKFFQFTLDKIKATKDECIVVGDNLENDVLGAINYGIDAIYFARDAKQEIKEHKDYRIVNSFSILMEKLLEL